MHLLWHYLDIGFKRSPNPLKNVFVKKSRETYLFQFSDAEPPQNSKNIINKLSNLTFVGDEVLQILKMQP